MQPTPHPQIGVIVVNHDGGELTIDCLQSVLATDWPSDRLRVVLVDNASSDGIAARVRRELPSVRVVESRRNLGFAGGCNLGLGEVADADYVALVNNDATVSPGWLAPLVDALVADPGLGAACPKILLAGRFVDIGLTSPTRRRGLGDRRPLGVHVSGARVGGVDVWPRTQLVRGFWGRDPVTPSGGRGEWTAGEARLRVPVGEQVRAEAELRLSADGPVGVTATSGTTTTQVELGVQPAWHTVHLEGPVQAVVNNVGTELVADGYGADRGYLEPDDGRFDAPEDVFAWCGAGVLLRREYLDDVGGFDERLFLYYEDVELSWRGRERGWRYRYVPESIVEHLHASSTVEGSALKDYFDERNHLLVLVRHAPGPTVVRAVIRFLLVTFSYARRDLLSPLLHGRRPRGAIVARRLRAFGGFAGRAASMLASRRRDRR